MPCRLALVRYGEYDRSERMPHTTHSVDVSLPWVGRRPQNLLQAFRLPSGDALEGLDDSCSRDPPVHGDPAGPSLHHPGDESEELPPGTRPDAYAASGRSTGNRTRRSECTPNRVVLFVHTNASARRVPGRLSTSTPSEISARRSSHARCTCSIRSTPTPSRPSRSRWCPWAMRVDANPSASIRPSGTARTDTSERPSRNEPRKA